MKQWRKRNHGGSITLAWHGLVILCRFFFFCSLKQVFKGHHYCFFFFCFIYLFFFTFRWPVVIISAMFYMHNSWTAFQTCPFQKITRTSLWKLSICQTFSQKTKSIQPLMETTLNRSLGLILFAGCHSVLKRNTTDKIYTPLPYGIMAASDPPLCPEAANDTAGCSLLSFLRSHWCAAALKMSCKIWKWKLSKWEQITLFFFFFCF